MKKLGIILGLVLLVTSATFANDYKLDEGKLDNMFASAQEISIVSSDFTANNLLSDQTQIKEGNKAVVAWILCWVVGGFGIHRHYLGTKSSMWALYCFTCGGLFGIVTLVDWWVLLINGVINHDISKYENNEKFFMWSN